MSTLTKDRTTGDQFLALYEQAEKELTAHDAPWLRRIRKAAIARYAELGLPGPRNEDWKFTSVAPIVGERFATPPADSAQAADAYRLVTHGKDRGVSLLCMNGNRPFLAEGSQALPPGVAVGGLAEWIAREPDLVERHLGKAVDQSQQPFAALNTAFLHDGPFVFVPPGVVVNEPIYLEYVVAAFNAEAPYHWQRRALIVLGENSSATVVERFGGLPKLPYFTNAVTEVVLDRQAKLDHYRIQREGDGSYHVGSLQVVQQRASNFSTHYVGFGGSLVRNEVRVAFAGEHAEATVNGLYRASGKQHVDNHTVIDHAVPNCASHELYKGILDGQAKGVFNGKIFVRLDAQKTDAKQTNQTLLLSDDATINTKPQLEIFADDVKCTHGATVGQLDDEALFYLRSRGLSKEEARRLLIYAFANDVVSRIQVPELRDQLEAMLLNRRDAS
jgi:Fe-S cluster assembly protein SufD